MKPAESALPDSKSDESFMRTALAEAAKAAKKGEIPVGAVVVHDREIKAAAHNQKESLEDPTAHAEVLAIREACAAAGTWHLDGATLFVTKEPCPMCAGAIVQARIGRVVFGASDPKSGAAGSVLNLLDHKLLNHRADVVQGVCERDSRDLLQVFFKKLRHGKNSE
ncbi:MAG: tRNA adenosine(34) deaminase TadA [Terriglobia bacterium]